MLFKVEIETSNAAFENQAGEEIALILTSLAGKVQGWPGANEFNLALFDVNGNKVGQAWTIN